MDRSCCIVFYNKALSRLEGLRTGDVIGKMVYEVFPSITPADSTLYQVINTGRAIRGQVQQYFNYQGKQITTVKTIPLWNGSEVLGALEVSHDISLVVCLMEKIASLQQTLSKGRSKKHSNPAFSFANIIGTGAQMRMIIDRLKKVAATNSPVLIYGETGTCLLF